MPTITAESPESFSAQIFKIPTHCLSTTLTLRNPGQRRLEIKIPFANQSIFSCYRVQNLLSEIMWYEVNRCQRMAIRNVGHYEAPTNQAPNPLLNCYLVKFSTFRPMFFIACCSP